MISVPETRSKFHRIATRLVRSRVGISSVLFIGLVAFDIVRGTKPTRSWLSSVDVIGASSALLVLLGLAIRSWAAGTLPKGVDLATTGPYSLCRHPLYLGSFAMIIGFCILLGHAHDYLGMLAPIAGIYYLTMRMEEQRLRSIYSTRCEEYMARVPMFIPWNFGIFRLSHWSGARWIKCREYRAIIGGIVGLIALEAWRRAGP